MKNERERESGRVNSLECKCRRQIWFSVILHMRKKIAIKSIELKQIAREREKAERVPRNNIEICSMKRTIGDTHNYEWISEKSKWEEHFQLGIFRNVIFFPENSSNNNKSNWIHLVSTQCCWKQSWVRVRFMLSLCQLISTDFTINCGLSATIEWNWCLYMLWKILCHFYLFDR